MNSNNWKLDLFTSLDSAHSLQAVMAASLDAIRPFGFDFCGWRTDLPTTDCFKKSNITVLNAVEDEVYNTTVNGGYQNAPIPCHCARSFAPISWRGTADDDVFAQSPEVMEEYFNLGHRGGWAIATMAADSTRGMFFVESRQTLSSSELYYAEQHMQWVSSAAYMRIIEVKSSINITLSSSENEILKQLFKANGNISSVAESSRLSIKQIGCIIKTLKKKLECDSIHSLICRALFLGLIE